MQKTLAKKNSFALVAAIVILGLLAYMAYMWQSGAQHSAVLEDTQHAGRFMRACGQLDRGEGIADCVSYYNDTLEVIYADKSGKWPLTGGPDQRTYEATYRTLAGKVAAFNSQPDNASRHLDLHAYQ
ncbi:MAG: hypothetical protein V4764_04455 [Burkholderia sp.]